MYNLAITFVTLRWLYKNFVVQIKIRRKINQKESMWVICNRIVFNFLFIIFLFVENVKLQKPNANDSDTPTHPVIYNIGGVLSSSESETHFATTISVSFIPFHYFLLRLLFFMKIKLVFMLN